MSLTSLSVTAYYLIYTASANGPGCQTDRLGQAMKGGSGNFQQRNSASTWDVMQVEVESSMGGDGLCNGVRQNEVVKNYVWPF